VSFAGAWITFASALQAAVGAVLVNASMYVAACIVASPTLPQQSRNMRPEADTLWTWFERLSAVLGVMSLAGAWIVCESLLAAVAWLLLLGGGAYLAACLLTVYLDQGLPRWTTSKRQREYSADPLP
jgi:hypothetical protein